MKTKTQLLDELDDAVVLLVDAIDSRDWLISWNTSHQITALCGQLQLMDSGLPVTLSEVDRALDKLGALLEHGSANVVHGE